jgi:hypothetical protein
VPTVSTQSHHILPTAVFDAFEQSISAWTEGSYNNNAGYNRVQLPVDVSDDSPLPKHNGSHPGLNNAWTNILDDIENYTHPDGTPATNVV